MSEPRLTVLRAADRKPSRWKNGGGMTTEIAVSPEGASLESFDWRVSSATLEADGPFSLFPGVDRLCAILAGAVSLRVGDAKPVALDTTSPPFCFPGDVPTHAQVLHGPVNDLNVFVRRGCVTGSIERFEWSDELVLQTAPGIALLLARTAGITLTCGPAKVAGLMVDDVVRICTTSDATLKLNVRDVSIAFLARLGDLRPQ